MRKILGILIILSLIFNSNYSYSQEKKPKTHKHCCKKKCCERGKRICVKKQCGIVY